MKTHFPNISDFIKIWGVLHKFLNVILSPKKSSPTTWQFCCKISNGSCFSWMASLKHTCHGFWWPLISSIWIPCPGLGARLNTVTQLYCSDFWKSYFTYLAPPYSHTCIHSFAISGNLMLKNVSLEGNQTLLYDFRKVSAEESTT